jgi:triosephosphate isomerase
MRKKIVAANWKMNKTAAEAAAYLESLLTELGADTSVETVVIPPFTALPKASEILGGSQVVKLGAQNVHPEKNGAFTGEISAEMLRDLYVRYVVIGHSERRALFGETDEFINKKVMTAHAASLRPILCIGETLEQRDAGQVERILEGQLRADLDGLDEKHMADTVIAYEPVWAIGTGRTATPEQAQEAHAFIRKTLAQLFGDAVAGKVRIQYGGSVKPANAAELMAQPDIDGALVGGASLDPHDFAKIIAAART